MAYNRYNEKRENREKDNILRKTGSSFFNMDQNYNNRSNNRFDNQGKPQIYNQNDLLKYLNPNTGEAVDQFLNYRMNNNISKGGDINYLNPDTKKFVDDYVQELNNNKNDKKSSSKSRNNQAKDFINNKCSYNDLNNNCSNNNYNKKYQINYEFKTNNYINQNVYGGNFYVEKEDARCQQIYLNYIRSRSPGY